MMFRIRNLRKELVVFKINNSPVPRLPLNIRQIWHEYVVGETLLTNLELEKDINYNTGYTKLKNTPYHVNCMFIEQNRRCAGYFERKFKEWRKKDGGIFDYLKLPRCTDSCDSSKKTNKQLKRKMRQQRNLEICNAQVLTPTEYERRKESAHPECNRYRYCRKNGLRQDISSEDLSVYVNDHDKSTSLFETMIFNRTSDDFNSEVNIKVFNKLIKCYGWKSIRDKRVFSEKNEDEVDLVTLGTLMERVSQMSRLCKTLEINRAKDDVYVWSKYAINKLGKMLGLCDKDTKIMTGERGYRVWSLRGDDEDDDDEEPNLYRRQLELVYMRNFLRISQLNPLEVGFNREYLEKRSTILYRCMDIDRLIIMCMIHSSNISTHDSKSPNKRERTRQCKIRNLHLKALYTLFSKEELSNCMKHIKEFATEDLDYHGIYYVEGEDCVEIKLKNAYNKYS
jgi:hypothetical protein